jgi:hypothetical protein
MQFISATNCASRLAMTKELLCDAGPSRGLRAADKPIPSCNRNIITREPLEDNGRFRNRGRCGISSGCQQLQTTKSACLHGRQSVRWNICEQEEFYILRMVVTPLREERNVGDRTGSTFSVVPDGEGAHERSKRGEQSQPGPSATLLPLVVENAFPALLLVLAVALLCVCRVEMYDVAVGKREFTARVLRLDGSSSARDIRV